MRGKELLHPEKLRERLNQVGEALRVAFMPRVLQTPEGLQMVMFCGENGGGYRGVGGSERKRKPTEVVFDLASFSRKLQCLGATVGVVSGCAVACTCLALLGKVASDMGIIPNPFEGKEKIVAVTSTWTPPAPIVVTATPTITPSPTFEATPTPSLTASPTSEIPKSEVNPEILVDPFEEEYCSLVNLFNNAAAENDPILSDCVKARGNKDGMDQVCLGNVLPSVCSEAINKEILNKWPPLSELTLRFEGRRVNLPVYFEEKAKKEGDEIEAKFWETLSHLSRKDCGEAAKTQKEIINRDPNFLNKFNPSVFEFLMAQNLKCCGQGLEPASGLETPNGEPNATLPSPLNPLESPDVSIAEPGAETPAGSQSLPSAEPQSPPSPTETSTPTPDINAQLRQALESYRNTATAEAENAARAATNTAVAATQAAVEATATQAARETQVVATATGQAQATRSAEIQEQVNKAMTEVAATSTSVYRDWSNQATAEREDPQIKETAWTKATQTQSALDEWFRKQVATGIPGLSTPKPPTPTPPAPFTPTPSRVPTPPLPTETPAIAFKN